MTDLGPSPAREDTTGMFVWSEVPALDQHPAVVYRARLGSTRSQRTMHAALNMLASLLGVPTVLDTEGHEVTFLHCNWAALRYQHTVALRAALVRQYEPATANVKIAALRGVLQEAWRLGQMTAEAYQRAADIARVRATTLLRGRSLASDALSALLTVCSEDTSAFGIHDAAMIAVMYCTSMRRSEVAALQLRDYDARAQSLKLVKGKGRKDQLVYLADTPHEALEAWLSYVVERQVPCFVALHHVGANKRMAPLSARITSVPSTVSLIRPSTTCSTSVDKKELLILSRPTTCGAPQYPISSMRESMS